GGAKLGDRRLKKRLFDLATSFFARPTANIPQACTTAEAKAAYRFFDHERTTLTTLIEPHRTATLDRMRREPIVLVVQDTLSLNFMTHRTINAASAQAWMLYNALAFRPDGLPLGILDVDSWRRDAASFEDKGKRQLGPSVGADPPGSASLSQDPPRHRQGLRGRHRR